MKRFKFNEKDVKVRDELVREAHFQYTQKRISRRDFLRFTTALGGGALAMSLLPPMESTGLKHFNRAFAAQDATQEAAMPVRGGNLLNEMGTDLKTQFDDPAKASNIFVSNAVRQVCDFLVVVDYTLTLRPSLATSWTTSTDGLTWTIKLRQGVKFNHGKTFNADDVVFTFKRLLDPATASGWAGAANYVTGVEKVDDSTVIFHTNRVAADFIYLLFNYQAAILPSDWPGDFYAHPWGTGPFTIDEYSPADHIRFKRREDYWQIGADGKSLPYLDTVEFDLYASEQARLSALQEGTLQLADATITLKDQYTALANFDFKTVQTANFYNTIMHQNEAPWDKVEARQAFKLAVDRQAYVDTLYAGFAIPANDQPIAPGLYPLAPASVTPTHQDYAQAKALLAKAGYPNGLDITVTYIDPASDNAQADKFAQFLVGQVAPAGIRLTLAPNPKYFDTWLNDWGANMMGIDNWGQRSTASEILNLAYFSKGIWNESHWNNADFDALLEKFDSNLDQASRADQLSQMMNLISTDGDVMIPGWRQDAYVIQHGIHLNRHPQAFHWFGDVWIEPST